MPGTFTCRHCGKTLPCNPRLKKKQKFCSSPGCQQERRSSRKKKRYQSDPVYRKRYLAGQKSWRETYPAHEYQKQYREDHPEYVILNREQQRERNKKRQKDPGLMIVNGTSLSLHPDSDKAYASIKVKEGKIVNGTSFIAQIQILSGREAVFLQNGT